jgi:predicted CXXCH cytochrome family protein
MKTGNWAATPNEIKGLANIQCENCHGPGGSHFGNAAKIDISFDAGVCAQCHGSEPYHVKASQWQDTKHALATTSPSGAGRETCVKCHTARGYVEYVKAGAPGLTFKGTDTEFAPISCQACHDPHSVTNEK